MDNRYLFRGKRPDNGKKWVKGSLHESKYIIDSHDYNGGFGSSIELICNAFEIDPATVGQCTGLSAAKSYCGMNPEDLLLFEGDIIKLYSNNVKEYHYIGEIAFCEGTYMFVCQTAEGGFMAMAHLENPCFNWEIIGNIHDNPELLTEAAFLGKNSERITDKLPYKQEIMNALFNGQASTM